MHILYLHQYFVPPDGSGGTRSYEMARRLVSAGHNVTLITSSAYFPAQYELGEGTTTLEIAGIHLRIINVPYSNRLSYLRRIKAFVDFALKATLEAVRVKNVDVIFATSTPLTIALPGIMGKLRHRKPMIFEVRDLWPELPIAIGALRNPLLKALAKWLERTAYTASTHVVALSPGMKEGVVGTGYPAERVTVIPNSCDVELFRQAQPPTGEIFCDMPHLADLPIVLYAGTFGPINDVGYLVEMAAAMRDINPTVRFVLAGDGKEREKVLARARATGVLDRNLWFIPPVNKNKMPALLAASTIATSLFSNIPEMWHNSANKFFDTLAAGRPVMINYGGWQAEIIRKSGAGLVLPPDDPAAAALQLHEFLSDEKWIEKSRTAARLLADTEFNRDFLFTKFVKVFETVHAGLTQVSP